ncbi:marvel domain-containing protein [Phaeosphaeriaceae sp. PMI808]|nr:marvel domain-containing protein [Phaeosphaeriaceae sp. PMI808]
MALSALLNFALRGFQALFGIIILGLSVTLIKGIHWGSLPSSIGYAAFVGGITVVAALVGLAATWVTFLEGWVGIIFDIVVALINLAGGITMTLKLDGVKCSINQKDYANNIKLVNEIFLGGCTGKGDKKVCWLSSAYANNEKKAREILLGHCRESQADMVFMYLATAAFIASALILFLRKRKGL